LDVIPDLPWLPSLQHPGSMHRQSTWEERATDAHVPLPMWQRVAFLAYARHRGNGHAPFAEGELLTLVQKAQPKAGERALWRALADAKRYGYLDDRSSLRCLVVPPTSVAQGLGHYNDPCGYCGKRNRRLLTKSVSKTDKICQ